MEKVKKTRIYEVLQATLYTLYTHKVVLIPYCFAAFVQLLVLEILYFSPRFPLNIFFTPVIGRLWNERYLHYPFDLVLLPKLFQYSQFVIYIFVSSFLVGMSINIITKINKNKKVTLTSVFKEVLPSYVHIVITASMMFLFIFLFLKSYGLLLARAQMIQSQSGIFFLIKLAVIEGSPYLNLFVSIIITTLFAYVIPIIVIEKQKFISALKSNFKFLKRNLFFTFSVVFISSMLFLPILLLRNSFPEEGLFPEYRLWVLIISLLVMILIDAIVYTSVALNYVLSKENK